MLNKDKLREIERRWPELAKADADANGGMGIDLMSAEVHAEMDGVSVETYIIAVLRAERIRRQAQDSIVRDRAMMEELVAHAHAAGMSVIDYTAREYGHGAGPEGLAGDFLRKLVRYLEERS